MNIDQTLGGQPIRQPQPRPTAPEKESSAAAGVSGVGMAGDAATLSSRVPAAPGGSTNAVQQGGLDQGGIAVGVQTLVQGATRGAAQVSKVRGLLVAANLAEGQGEVIKQFVEAGSQGVRAVAAKVAPGYVNEATRLASPLLKGAGASLRVLGKVAPGLNVLVAGYDTAKAVGEQDPAKKDAAWANAGLSVGGTALAVGGVLVGATPVGWVLGAGAAAVAAFQLVDTFAFGGKGTGWLGKHVARPIAAGAKKLWSAITGR